MLRVSTSRSWRRGNQRGAAAAAGEGRQLGAQKGENRRYGRAQTKDPGLATGASEKAAEKNFLG